MMCWQPRHQQTAQQSCTFKYYKYIFLGGALSPTHRTSFSHTEWLCSGKSVVQEQPRAEEPSAHPAPEMNRGGETQQPCWEMRGRTEAATAAGGLRQRGPDLLRWCGDAAWGCCACRHRARASGGSAAERAWQHLEE